MILAAQLHPTTQAALSLALAHFDTPPRVLSVVPRGMAMVWLAQHYQATVRVIALTLSADDPMLSPAAMMTILRMVAPRAMLVAQSDDPTVSAYARLVGGVRVLPTTTPATTMAAAVVHALAQQPPDVPVHHPAVQALRQQAACAIMMHQHLRQITHHMAVVQQRLPNRELARALTYAQALI